MNTSSTSDHKDDCVTLQPYLSSNTPCVLDELQNILMNIDKSSEKTPKTWLGHLSFTQATLKVSFHIDIALLHIIFGINDCISLWSDLVEWTLSGLIKFGLVLSYKIINSTCHLRYVWFTCQVRDTVICAVSNAQLSHYFQGCRQSIITLLVNHFEAIVTQLGYMLKCMFSPFVVSVCPVGTYMWKCTYVFTFCSVPENDMNCQNNFTFILVSNSSHCIMMP